MIAQSVKEALVDAAEAEVGPALAKGEQAEDQNLSETGLKTGKSDQLSKEAENTVTVKLSSAEEEKVKQTPSKSGTEVEQPVKSFDQQGVTSEKQDVKSKLGNAQTVPSPPLDNKSEGDADQIVMDMKQRQTAEQSNKTTEQVAKTATTEPKTISDQPSKAREADKIAVAEHQDAKLTAKPQPEIAVANQSKAAQQVKAEGPANTPVDAKMNPDKQPSTVKNVTDVQTVVEKLTVPQQQELKAVMAGKLDIFDASPSVQKAVAQLIGKGMDMTSLSQFKMTTQAEAVVGTDESESMTSEVKSDVKTVNLSNVPANAEPKEAPAKSTPTSTVEMKEKKVEQPPSDNEQKALAEKANIEKQASEELTDKELGKLAQAEASMAKETVKVERQQSAVVTPNTAKPEVSTLNAVQQDDTSLNQTLKEVQQVQQSQSTTNTAAQAKQAVDPHLQQAINIARQDAAKELHQRVGMMLNLNNKEAEIRLDPPELGAMQIRIKSDAEQAQVNIVVQNQQAKELLEQSMPRLREMLAEQGIELGDSQISHQQQSDAESDSQGGAGNQGGQLAQGDEEEISNGSSTTQKRNTDSAIDYYA
ncbi:flagellar hook-length control protein FliK [Pseudoalteromonas piscicida]|uniref:flagellar hook-length control protein FliK n=1 Tax=Pseudoalteromonas piscicida TaxID=43662 RepID=UPI001F5BB71F|nr:flagellar hook-length control protein FliK [Pseudoalteromonas piscicida]